MDTDVANLSGARLFPYKCKLKVMNLPFHLDVDALSYVYGMPEPPEEIELDGSCKLVTQNLFAALRRLRFPDKERLV
jgi:hypothetical protein